MNHYLLGLEDIDGETCLDRPVPELRVEEARAFLPVLVGSNLLGFDRLRRKVCNILRATNPGPILQPSIDVLSGRLDLGVLNTLIRFEGSVVFVELTEDG